MISYVTEPTGEWVSYDDTNSIREKVNYIQDQNLGGAMIWELTGDDENHTLLQLIHSELND
ncbi:hypothetical protein DID80_01160 [Candidatus Marinamargulisbacteria bacterium SCGC AAA071-K20]|nr:hypothetical protein DID80_01160 [Candidatus Marinamargulisbacteria bacterium SCGC AAA071-K20]